MFVCQTFVLHHYLARSHRIDPAHVIIHVSCQPGSGIPKRKLMPFLDCDSRVTEMAVNGGQTCGDCVRKTTYPIKEQRYADRQCIVHAPDVS
jgi:hypothetical protein